MNRPPSFFRSAAALGRHLPVLMAASLAGAAGFDAAAATLACTAHSGSAVTPVVELYTSEGCSSCPPADRWLSALAARPDVVGLAFHVDYWDRLGWKDRFASPRYTRRQVEQQAVNGARFAYTPQVVVDGHDRSDWPRLVPQAGTAKAPVGIALSREGDHVSASVVNLAPSPTRLTAYWAVTEFGHRSIVRAGENDGATLAHDFVVREYQPVQAWQAAPGQAQTLSHDIRDEAEPGHARRINLVVTDAQTGRPLQALALGC